MTNAPAGLVCIND